MKIKNIAFVGIPVTDMKCARAFYENVLGLQPDPEMTGEHWTEYSIGEGTLAIACVGEQWKPSNEGTSAALEVENLEEAIARFEEGRSLMIKLIRQFAVWPSSMIRTVTN